MSKPCARTTSRKADTGPLPIPVVAIRSSPSTRTQSDMSGEVSLEVTLRDGDERIATTGIGNGPVSAFLEVPHLCSSADAGRYSSVKIAQI
jgi:hypothetical protein